MNQSEKRTYLIKRLLNEKPEYADMNIPTNSVEQRTMLRSLMNIRMPGKIDDEFLKIQDEYLKQVNEEKDIVTIDQLEPVKKDIYLWQGDITRLRVGAIVNAANSGMTGCYQPCHNCIDNCIHTYAGVQLRYYCSEIMEKQGFEVTYLDVDEWGSIRLDILEKAIRKDTILISVMYANNEVGTIQKLSLIHI